MVLDATKHEDKWNNKGCKLQRAGKPPLYLAATEDNSGDAKCTESAAKPTNDPYDDDNDLCRAYSLYMKIAHLIDQIDFGEVSLASHALRHITLE
ncbi:hypothetical protein [Bradyrhizobium sp. STM 3566]|uniref:hypothetical protein n=1 Tax=Bradyrhizobium sp. STM 3566 TaxID=578928 RepID=UPI00388FA494